jgi:DNA polymerase V
MSLNVYKMYALIDCNNFYASCERVFRPDLNGKPIVVLSNNDGCVIARSNEAKEVGVPMGIPAFECEKLFKQHSIHVFSANFSLYGDMSSRVMSLLDEFSPEVEVYSIDEAFLYFSNVRYLDLNKVGTRMRTKIGKWTGIPICVGIAPTKTLAKVANRIAKKFQNETGGVYVIDTEEKRLKALKWLKVEDVWGIGRKHAQRLNLQGIKTALDFVNTPESWVKKQLSVVGWRLQRDLKGISTLRLEELVSKKSIAITRTFERGYVTFEDLHERIMMFVALCAEKLRKQNSACQALLVFAYTNRLRLDQPQYGKSVVVQLPFASNSTIDLMKIARIALTEIFKEGYTYKKAGVIAQDLLPTNIIQTTLFDVKDERHNTIMKVMDTLNNTYGQQKLRLASQGTGMVWKMKQERLSPRYTTHIDEIITINV